MAGFEEAVDVPLSHLIPLCAAAIPQTIIRPALDSLNTVAGRAIVHLWPGYADVDGIAHIILLL